MSMDYTTLHRYPQSDSPVRARWRFRSLRCAPAVAFLVFGCAVPSEFCQQNPDDLACDETVVSETGILRLELEQLDDGGASYPRRGTITMRLRVNTTDQPDPTCEDSLGVMTFLADVEVFPSRLQGPATGSADGSWNCHGFTATVALTDRTRYELRSDEPWGGRPLSHLRWVSRPDVPPRDVRWSAGARRGQFAFSYRTMWQSRIRESHVDVLVQNQSGNDWDISLDGPNLIGDPFVIRYFEDVPGARRNGTFETVPAGGAVNFSWPAHPARREEQPDDVEVTSLYGHGPGAFRWAPRTDNLEGFEDMSANCYLPPDHGDRVEVLIHDEWLECGDGYVGGVYVAPARTPLFIQAPEDAQAVQDTVTIVAYGERDFLIESTESAITASLARMIPSSLLTVTVAPGAPRGEHGLRVIGRSSESTADTAFIPVYVYELDVTTAADTLSIAPSASDTTSVLVDGVGFFSPIRFGATDLPSGALQGVPTFNPAETNRTLGAASTVTLTVDATAPLGTYDLTLCGTIVEDPMAICHPAPLTLVVTEAGGGACQDFNLRLDFNPIEVAAGGSDAVAVFIDRVDGFAGQVELMPTAGPGPTYPSDVLSTWAFSLNPVDGSTNATTFSFTTRGDLTVDEQYELTISGGSPLLETDPEWCTIPVTFEVIQ